MLHSTTVLQLPLPTHCPPVVNVLDVMSNVAQQALPAPHWSLSVQLSPMSPAGQASPFSTQVS
jgi:hypothetical protein